ncbi:MAG: hypothetical protein A4E69_00006 [Syntrophus sp. PtaB.Bin138]|nr:MAG: hypothetical protein A4E69_00006 [Syntrophus sp. PtaB.Bin138]
MNPAGVFLDNEVGHLPLLEALRNGVSDTAPSDDEDRIHGKLADVVKGINLVVGCEVLLRSGENQNAVRIDPAFRMRDLEIAPFPDSHHRHSKIFSQAAFREGFSHQGGAQSGKLGDDQLIEPADDIGPAFSADGPGRQGISQHVVKLQDPRTAGHDQDVLGIGGIGGCDDLNLLTQLSNCKGNVRVDLVPVGRNDEGGAVCPHPAIRLGIIDVPHGDAKACIIELQRAAEILLEEDIALPVILQPFNEGHRHRIVAGDDHMVFRIRRQLAGGPVPRLRFNPGGIKKLDEDKGKQGEKEKNP